MRLHAFAAAGTLTLVMAGVALLDSASQSYGSTLPAEVMQERLVRACQISPTIVKNYCFMQLVACPGTNTCNDLGEENNCDGFVTNTSCVRVPGVEAGGSGGADVHNNLNCGDDFEQAVCSCVYDPTQPNNYLCKKGDPTTLNCGAGRWIVPDC